MELAEILERYPGAVTYQFGDGPEISAELLELVRAGRKRATCLPMADVERGQALPQIGRCDIATTFEGVPALVTRTMELRLVRFEYMPEELALMEGESEDLATWKAMHERYFERQGIFAPDMELIWERFEVVEDLGGER